VDKKIYNFESQQREKKRLKKKVLISAVNLSNKDKFDVNSLKFLEDYKENEISITLLGQSSNLIIDSKFEIVKMGYIEDENKIANLYRSADVLFYPSLAESCGLTILEAACCNLPVLCYSNTAISELICELNLNLLVRKEKILDNLNEPNSNRVPDIKDMFKKYLELYKMIN
jgi:glycosyltransferase involved in cell wall biosynthesis